MHEASAVQCIFNELEKKIQANEIKHPILAIHIKLGKLTTFVPSNLQFLFEVYSKDTLFENTKLIIEEIPIQCVCNQCNRTFIIEELQFLCPECFSSDLTILSGREFLIDSIEVPNE